MLTHDTPRRRVCSSAQTHIVRSNFFLSTRWNPYPSVRTPMGDRSPAVSTRSPSFLGRASREGEKTIQKRTRADTVCKAKVLLCETTQDLFIGAAPPVYILRSERQTLVVSHQSLKKRHGDLYQHIVQMPNNTRFFSGRLMNKQETRGRRRSSHDNPILGAPRKRAEARAAKLRSCNQTTIGICLHCLFPRLPSQHRNSHGSQTTTKHDNLKEACKSLSPLPP